MHICIKIISLYPDVIQSNASNAVICEESNALN